MRITINESVTAPTALTVYEIPDFETLYRNLQNAHTYTDDKTDSDLLVPVAEWKSLHRAIGNIRTMSSIFCCDLDSISEETAEKIFDALEGTSCIVYTTHSHLTPRKNGLGCYRVIVELDREYPLADFPRVWQAVNRRLGGYLDPATLRHPELGYYLPSSPLSSDSSTLVLGDGRAWSVDTLLAEAPAESSPPKPKSKKAVAPSKTAMRLQMIKWGRASEHGKIAARWLEGKNILELHQGQRNNALIAIAGYIAAQWPDVDPEELSGLYEGIGYDLFNSDGKYPLERFTDAIARMQDSTKAERAEEARKKIEASTAGARSSLVTPEEIENLSSLYGDWTKFLIAICETRAYFLLPSGHYSTHSVALRGGFLPAVRDNLAVWGDYAKLTVSTERGDRRMTSAEITTTYGTTVSEIAYSYEDDAAPWDPETRTIFLHRRRPSIQPRRHESVARWLEACESPILLDMLASMTDHTRPLPALILTGKRSTGKTLLAECVSQIYADAPADAEEVFGLYPAAALRKCPIVFADEKLPREYRELGTTKLRSFITKPNHSCNEKFCPMTNIRGYLRFIVAANDPSQVLTTREEMSTEDREAFGERLVHVSLDKGKEVLQAIGREKISRDWVLGRHFAEHVLWLRDHHAVMSPGQRMLVEQDADERNLPMSSMSEQAESVMIWALHYLADPQKLRNPECPVAITQGVLRINASAVAQSWELYMGKSKMPVYGSIGRALRSMSDGSHRQRVKGKLGYVMDRKQLRQANDLHGIVDDLDRALSS